MEVSVAGVRIAYEEVGAGPPLVLVMGLGISSAGWQITVPWLAERYRVITIDNRGCGRSDTPVGRYSTSQMAGDVLAVLDALAIDAAHVYGLSMGGMIAQELAIRHPERVRALVLGATAPGGALTRPPDPLLFAALATRTLAHGAGGVASLYGLLFSERFLAANADALDESREQVVGMLATPDGYRRQLAATITHDAADRLHLIQAPTLVVQGTADRLVPPANARILAGRIARAELFLLPGAGHAYEYEEPDVSREVILAFLERHRDTPAGTPLHGAAPSGITRAGRVGGALAAHVGRYAVGVPVGLARRALR
jgi:pimeloyl-ACP methyl ester carboxylesterase